MTQVITSRRTLGYWQLVGLLCVVVAGCGGKKIDESTMQSSQQAYDSALGPFSQGDYATARTALDEALQGKGLNVDTYSDALVKRAICAAAAGDFDVAKADIAEAERGAPDMSIVHVAKGFLLAKQGDDAGAQAEFTAAKQINPNVEVPEVD